MRQPLDSQGSPEDYVAGLRHKRPANSYTEPDTVVLSVSKPDVPTSTPKRVDTGISGPVRCLTYAATLTVGVVIGAVLIATHDPPAPQPAGQANTQPKQPSVEPTKPTPPKVSPTKTVVALPPECEEALRGIQQYLDSAANVASVNDKQIDIMSEANRAIITKDWEKLRELTVRQMTLESTLANDNAKVLPAYRDLTESLNACRSHAKPK